MGVQAGGGGGGEPFQQSGAQGGEPGVGDLTRPVQFDVLLMGDPAAVHDQDTVGEQHRLLDVVRDQQHRAAPALPHLPDQALGLDPGERVEGAERLVEQQQAGLAHQRAGEGGALGLASGQGLRPGVDAMTEADLVQRPLGDVPFGAARKSEQDVAPHLLPGHEPGCLEGDGPAARDQGRALDVPVEAREDAQQGGLAAAAAPEQGDELAGCDVESEVVDDRAAVEGAGQPLDMDRGPGHRPVNVGRHCSSSLSRERTMKSASRPRKA